MYKHILCTIIHIREKMGKKLKYSMIENNE